MNFVAQLEDHLRDLGAEARKRHPGVKEASERATLKLRTLKNQYVSAVRKAAADGEAHPSTSMFRSSDLLHPFLLAANYPNASPKLLDISFKAMKILMEAGAICPGDGMNMVRVWMIQAQVVVSYSIKEGNPKMSSSSNNTTITSSTSSSSSDDAAQPTGSWLGSFLSTTSAKETAKAAMTVATKAAVSSSHGQAGSGHLSARDLEKLALDILSCLLQLLELRDLPISIEQWNQSVALCCLFYLPSRQTVRQAAHSTLPQVLTLLVKDGKGRDLAVATWEDLLACALGLPKGNGKKSSSSLKGAFSLCRNNEKDAAPPPSPSLSLDLMTTLLREAPFLFSKVGRKTLGVVVQILQKQTNDEACTAMEYLRTLQFVAMVLQTQAKDWPTECRELVARLIAPIPLATEALRSQVDFEDGFIYTFHNKTLLPQTTTIETLRGLPPTLLWKASLAMDTIRSLVQDKSLQSIWMDSAVLTQLLEATSDFCTIGASCEDHMNLVVLACRRKEQSLAYAAESLNSSDLWNKGKTKEDTYILGEAVWTGFNGVLKIIEHLEQESLEQAFAPLLAVLQHYLKRFPASGTIVNKALEGYFALARVSLKLSLIRRALMTSLCKLSLPQWGTQDPTCLLRDHNIAGLVCLVNIVHRFHNSIGSEWSIVLQTFQELSILPIASPHLSDNAYIGALSISAVYSRFSSFSTILSDEALSHFVEGLREVMRFEQPPNLISNPLGGNGRMSVPSKSNDGTSKEEKETIRKSIVSIGVRAIYGSATDTNSGQIEDVPLTERTKNSFSHDYQSEFSQRVAASKHPLRANRVPFSFALMLDVAMANTFRSGKCETAILQNLCDLAVEVPSFRTFSMDAAAMLIMTQMAEEGDFPASFQGPGKLMYPDPRQNQYLAVERIRNSATVDQKSVDQKALLDPLRVCISTSSSAEVAEAGVDALSAILESCSHDFDDDAWVVIIQAVASLPSEQRISSEWSGSCLVGFRCLKLIVDEFAGLPNPSAKARSALLDCCSSFGSSQHDVNTSLTAIGLLWTIADQDVGSASIDYALSKLVALSLDTRAEVRNCAVNTLFSCIAGRGQTFNNLQWKDCLCSMIFPVFDRVTASIESAGGADENISEKKSRYQVSVHHSRDSVGKQWIGTQALVLRGLSRVLRNFFPSLLKTTEDDGAGNMTKESDTPWFDNVWNKILAYAFDAAMQLGGRDTLDLRTAGTELLVLSALLSCKEGIQAAITPARVGTNMEVVNGALRTVRSPERDAGRRDSPRHSQSAITEMWRANLFLDSFDVLDSFREYLESDASNHNESGLHHTLEPTQVQVLAKFGEDLARLYQCCKNDEFSEDRQFDEIENFESLLLMHGSKATEGDAAIERFVQIVVTIVLNTSSGANARFLSQAQRACIELLTSMACDGSPCAFFALSELCGDALYLKDDGDILEQEVARILLEAFEKDSLSDETRVLILCRALKGFLEKSSNINDISPSYAKLASLITLSLPAAKRIQETNARGPKAELSDFLWEKLLSFLTYVLKPVPEMSKRKSSAHHDTEITQIVKVLPEACPKRRREDFCNILAQKCSKELELARAGPPQNSTLGLFGACFGAACQINSANRALEKIADDVLSSTGSAVSFYRKNPGDPLEDVHVKACLLICHSINEFERAELLAIALFPQLCLLVGTDVMELRKAIGDVLAKVNISKIIAESESLRFAAEERAIVAEIKLVELTKELESLRAEKETLERQLALQLI